MVNKATEKKELQAFIKTELNNIHKLLSEMDRYKKYNSKAYRRAKGSTLHDFYNCCERIFETIVRKINGGIREKQPWHKRLLYQMTMEVKGVRPSVLSQELAADLNEYLAFRQLFRNIYGFELESERLDQLVEKFEATVKTFEKEIQVFLRKL